MQTQVKWDVTSHSDEKLFLVTLQRWNVDIRNEKTEMRVQIWKYNQYAQ